MNPYHAILAILLAMPSHYRESEPTWQRSERLEQTAQAIHRAARGDRELVAALLALGTAESSWANYVHWGCRWIPGRAPNCDAGRARSYWQLHRASCPSLWPLEPGTQEWLDVAAACAVGRLGGARYRCRRGWAGAFSGYGSMACDSGWATGRAALMQNFLERLRRLGA